MKTPQELLIPRVKVIAPYPHSPWLPDMILIEHPETGEMYSEEFGFVGTKQIVKFSEAADFPAVFRLLGWWEDISSLDLPSYVKDNYGNFTKVIYRAHEGVWRAFDSRDADFPYKWDKITPATEEDYNSYINSKSQTK